MADPKLSPGDKVADLAFLLRSSAVFTGAVAASISLWALKHTALWIVLAGLLGGAGGFLLGTLLGSVFFSAAVGQVTVVKLGPGALQAAFKVGLIGGITSGILAAMIPVLILAETSSLAQLLGAGVIVGVVVGAAFAYLVTRP